LKNKTLSLAKVKKDSCQQPFFPAMYFVEPWFISSRLPARGNTATEKSPSLSFKPTMLRLNNNNNNSNNFHNSNNNNLTATFSRFRSKVDRADL
jgi:hypothetical protein